MLHVYEVTFRVRKKKTPFLYILWKLFFPRSVSCYANQQRRKRQTQLPTEERPSVYQKKENTWNKY